MKYIYRGQKNKVLNGTDKQKLGYTIVIALLTIALIISIATRFVGGGTFTMDGFEENINTMMKAEMRQAISAAEELNRSASTGTSNTLSRVRQHVHGLQVLNSMSILVHGQSGRVIPQQDLDNTQSVINSFNGQLQTGQTIGQVLSKLMEALNILQASVNAK